ncbi:hypothetical protein [Legionella spiritensis]|uniref:hypothetical protein n=1 Tax=Legionella spiritensis TaxID=452 RepID=UPI000F6BC52F|nr:hypothetical protein [Legionella spiritensis]VEG92082.1 Uncharacterised protein [Legionella spiritensis]
MDNIKDIINPTIQSISAIGTLIVACIALWLTIRDSILRVKANFSSSILPSVSDPQTLNRYAYTINITNIGKREAIINPGILWHIHLFSKKKYIVDVSYMFNEFKEFNPKNNSNFSLKDGQNLNIFYSPEIFFEMEVNNKKNTFIFRKNKLVTYFCIYTFRAYIKTSLDKKIKIKASLKFRNNLRKEYLSEIKKMKKS